MANDNLDGFVQLQQALAQYTQNIDSTVDSVLSSVAKEAKDKLKENSPEKTGKFAKGWSIQHKKGEYTIYNKEAWKTHLLENGHDIVSNGKKVGRVEGKNFIAPINDWIQEEVIRRMEDEL